MTSLETISPIHLLAQICECDPPEATTQHIENSEAKQAYVALQKIGAIRHVDNARVQICYACDKPHAVAVEPVTSGRYRSFCPEVGYYDVPANQLKTFGVDLNWLALRLAEALGIRNAVTSQSVPNSLIRIGKCRIGHYTCSLFFGRRLDRADVFHKVVVECERIASQSPTIIVSSTPLSHIQGTFPPRCAAVHLCDVVSTASGKFKLDEDPFIAVLRGNDPRFRGGGMGFTFTPGYRSGVVGDKDYRFTDRQALVIEELVKARSEGNGIRHHTELAAAAGTNQRVGQLFRNHPAYGSLIKYDTKGYYWLNL